jgi:hypothetical protein
VVEIVFGCMSRDVGIASTVVETAEKNNK